MQQIMQLKDKASQILAIIKKNGGTGEVLISYGDGLTVEVRNRNLETLEFHQTQRLSLTVYVNQSRGSAAITNLDDASIARAVDTAFNFAKYTKADVHAGLADEHLMAKEMKNLDLFHQQGITSEQAIKLALDCEETAFATDKNIKQGSGTSFTSMQGGHIYANTHNFIGAQTGTKYSLSCSMIAGTGDDMQTDYVFDVKRNFKELSSVKSIGMQAAKKCVNRLNARKIATTNAQILFAPEIAKGLIKTLLSALNGYNLYHKSSFLVDALGSKIFPDWMQIYEDPHILGAIGSGSFDCDGLATYPKHIIADGIVQNYILDTYSARCLGLSSTANSGVFHNILVNANTDAQDAMISNIKRGLLVTGCMGHGINLLNGDYSRGASGFWIENGQIQFPVEEITIAGNLRNMFQQIIAVGADIDTRSSVRVGSILVDKMTIAGN